jgi:DNA-directed RNA polymerase II subunit RPB3
MSYISNLNINEDVLSFDLNNKSKDIKISLANAIRRTIISDIATYAIDEKYINFIENTSMLNNEFLAHRLTLIPIVSNLKDINYDNIIISCKKKNESENMESVYVKDFECKDSETQEIIDNSLIFKYPNILFGKLRNGNVLSFESKLTQNNSEYGGSFFCPVSTCVYTFKIDAPKIKEMTNELNESERLTFNLQNNERIYLKNDDGEPETYQFKLESIGFFDVKEIVKLGINALVTKLLNVKFEFRNKEKESRIKLIDESDFFVFSIDKENETIGNLLSTYLTYDKNVYYSGYVIEHPLKHNILLKIKLNSSNNLENVIDTIDSTIDFIVDLLEKINSEF